VLCASPDYLARFGEPGAPEELRKHRCLRLRTPALRGRTLAWIDPTRSDRRLEVEFTAVMSANPPDTLMRATIAGAGAGISSQPVDLVAPLLKSGALRRVLAPWITNRLRLVAALPSREFIPARARAFLDHLVDHTRRSLSGLGVAT
jgi:DNA-binding transcriptional LysR family regulator